MANGKQVNALWGELDVTMASEILNSIKSQAVVSAA
jgi:hypothetical protein